jgi:hypothetical protein
MEGAMSEARIHPQRPGSRIGQVYPVEEREHVIVGTRCWCRPHLYRYCIQCDFDDPACWACGGDGIIRIRRMAPGDRVLVVHHFIPDDATFLKG